MNTTFKTYPMLFLIGALCYSLIELVYRGHTHWTMAATGGVVLCVLCSIHLRLPDIYLYEKCLLGTMFITSLEFTEGVILNRILGLRIWDYSDAPFKAIPHKDCASDAKSDFSLDCTKSMQAYWRMSKRFCAR